MAHLDGLPGWHLGAQPRSLPVVIGGNHFRGSGHDAGAGPVVVAQRIYLNEMVCDEK